MPRILIWKEGDVAASDFITVSGPLQRSALRQQLQELRAKGIALQGTFDQPTREVVSNVTIDLGLDTYPASEDPIIPPADLRTADIGDRDEEEAAKE